MPLSPRQQALLIEASTGATGAVIGSTASAPFAATAAILGDFGAAGASSGAAASALGGVAGGLFGALVVAPVAAGLFAQLSQQRFPRLSPGEIGQAVDLRRGLEARGLDAVFTTDPFTGNLAVSTADQARFLPDLLFEALKRDVLTPPPQLIDLIRRRRDLTIARAAAASGAPPLPAPPGTSQFIRPPETLRRPGAVA